MKNKSSPGTALLRTLPFLFTLMLLCSVLILNIDAGASAEGASDDEDSLPEYTLTLSDAGISSSCDSVVVDGSTVTITEAGSYTVSGALSDGQIRIEAAKEDKVRLVLDGVSITNSDSAAIYVVSADKLVIKLKDGSSNTLTTSGSFVQTDSNNVDGVIFSKEDVTVKGSGSLTVSAPYGHGIVSKDDLTVKSGSISISAGRKALSANDELTVEDGTLDLIAGTEGMEATQVILNGGSVSIQAGDDGINATALSDIGTPVVEINGGDITIVMGAGDTDGVDSNGNLIITGGTIRVNGSSCFDYDGSVSFTGGTVIINGQQVDSIPNQMMGGGFGGMGPGGQMGGFGSGFDGMQPGQGDFDGGFGGGFGGRGHGRPNDGNFNRG
ncbi:MAG: carbohydrate-binding domain-containing protein [Oscillospiraceae bacterium]|nr:carbohydrate-binding domain-containing protein [Oscillospiraceae bacterium]